MPSSGTFIAANRKEDNLYYPDFIARCLRPDGTMLNLVIEVTGMNKEKAAKKDYVLNRWLPAINNIKDQYAFDEWDFIEIANDITDIKNQLRNKINGHSTLHSEEYMREEGTTLLCGFDMLQ